MIILMITSERQGQVAHPQRYNSKLQLYLINGNIALSSFYVGYIQIYLAAIEIQTIMQVYSVPIDQNVAQGLLNGCIPLGAIFGGLSIQVLLSKFSRRNSLLFINLIAFLAGILIYQPNFYTFVVFRLVQGMCVGFYSGLPLLMIKQLTPVELSGTMGNLTQLNLNLGMILGYFITYIFKKTTDDYTGSSFWQYIFGFPMILIILQSIILVYIFPYETPKYLLMNNKTYQAKKLIKLIYRQQYQQQILTEKLKDLQKIAKQDSDEQISTNHQKMIEKQQKIVISTYSNRLAIIAAIHIACFLQLTGISVLNVYCGPIAQKKATGEIKLLVPTLLNITKMIGAMVGSIIISCVNRKSIFQMGLFLLCIANTLIFVGFYVNSPQFQDSAVFMIVLGMFVYLGCFGATLGPISWLYLSQIVQPRVFSISVAVVWAIAALVVFVFPIIEQQQLDGNPSMLFLFFALYCVFSFAINHFLLVETRNKTEKQIQESYQNLKIC